MLSYNTVNINAQNRKGQTALHIAIANQNYKGADLLLDYGIDDKVTDNKGKTAWDGGNVRGSR